VAGGSSAALLERYQPACQPPLWARSGHAQTLLGHLLPSPGSPMERTPGAVRRELELEDGDRLVLFELPGTSGVRVHLFHGLSGDVDAEYMRRTTARLQAEGHAVWAVNHRGCGAGRGLARGAYHSGKTEDLAAVLAASRAEAPELVHLVIGFSLSGNLCLLHAGRGESPRADGLVAVNPPVDLERCALDLQRGLSRLYDARFMRRLRRTVRERERAGHTQRSYSLPRGTSLREFDDLVTAPECGFADGLDYYRQCSSLPHLGAIETPTVILTAGDDPFVDPSVYAGAELSSEVLLHLEPNGGHVGYLTRRGLGWGRWLDGALLHYVDALASHALRTRRRPSVAPRGA